MESKIIYNNGEGSTTVIWASRHPPLSSQILMLEKALGKVRIIMVSGIIPSAESLAELAKKYDAKVIVPVLPLSFIARLAELQRRYGFIVLWSEMQEITRTLEKNEAERLVREKEGWRTAIEYSGGIWRVWEFKGFKRVLKVELVTEPWP